MALEEFWQWIWVILSTMFPTLFNVEGKPHKDEGGVSLQPDPPEPVSPDIVTPVPETVPDGPGARWYMTPPIKALLNAIGSVEAGSGGYNADYRNDDHWILTNKDFDHVRELGRSQVTSGEGSSAIGRYQFLTRTLDGLKRNLGLTGDEIFDEDLQDDLAYHLMVGRGLNKYLSGRMSTSQFCNNLAKEWASLPVVVGIKGARLPVKRGQSYYAAVAGNRALVSAEKFETLVEAIRG